MAASPSSPATGRSGPALALADPDQIASLSRFARDPSMSYLHEQAQHFPQNRGTAEDLVKIEADLALVGSYDAGYTRELLQKRGLAFLPVPPWGYQSSVPIDVRHAV